MSDPATPASDGELGTTIVDGAITLGLPLANLERDRLVAYIRQIERWNGAYNLTAVRDPRAMAVQHVIDCLAVVSPLRRRLGAVATRARVLDVGSGAGLPGVVIAVMEPSMTVVCVDSVGKKAAFVTQASVALGLVNVRSMHARVESLSDQYDVVASRAFASAADFVRLTRHLIAKDGWWMAMKGKPTTGELVAAGVEFHVEPLQVPGLDADRCIVWMW